MNIGTTRQSRPWRLLPRIQWGDTEIATVARGSLAMTLRRVARLRRLQTWFQPGAERHFLADRRGFTLIELLVVIAVIAVLMGILMPALQKAKEQAQTAACGANLKGYTLAVQMYAGDNDNLFTDGHASYFRSTQTLPGETGALSQRWCNGEVNLGTFPELGSEFFRNYLVNAKSLICPTFKRIAKSKADASSTARWDEGNEDVAQFEPWMNYCQNAYLGPKSVRAGLESVVTKTMQVKYPATVVTFMDEGPYADTEVNTQGLNDTNLIPVAPVDVARTVVKSAGNKELVKPHTFGVNTFYDVIAGFHHAPTGNLVAGKGNCAFVDGHVDAVNRLDTFSVCWPL